MIQDSLRDIKNIANQITSDADLPAHSWQQVKSRDIRWCKRPNNMSRSVQWAATKQARKLIEICGDEARKGYLIINGEAWPIRTNPCGFWLERPKEAPVILYYLGEHLASPITGRA